MKAKLFLVLAALVLLSGCATFDAAKGDFRKLTDRMGITNKTERDVKAIAGTVNGATTSEVQRSQDGSFRSMYVDLPESSLNSAQTQKAIRNLRERARELASENESTIDFIIVSRPAGPTSGRKRVESDPQYERAGNGRIRFVIREDADAPKGVRRVLISNSGA